MKKEEILKYIKYLRLKHNYTQQQLADKVGIERCNLSRLERGGNPTLDTLIKIITIFDEQIHISPKNAYHNHLVQKIGSEIKEFIMADIPKSSRHIKYGWVYIINLKNDKNTIKIGFTHLDEPSDRLSTISDIFHPGMDPGKSEVELYYARLASDCKLVEKQMHMEFEISQINGEWFNINCEIAKNKLDQLINDLDTPHL